MLTLINMLKKGIVDVDGLTKLLLKNRIGRTKLEAMAKGQGAVTSSIKNLPAAAKAALKRLDEIAALKAETKRKESKVKYEAMLKGMSETELAELGVKLPA